MIPKESIAAKIVEAGGKLTVKSALNPVLWLCAIVTLPCLIMATVFTGALQTWLFFMASIPIVAAVLGFFFLLVYDRDKLQSEEYQIKKQTLEFMQQKGQTLPSSIEASEVIPPPEILKMLEGDFK